MIEFFFILLGILLGIFTGLIPGIHTNLFAVILLAYSFDVSSISLVFVVLSMSVTHSFVSIIPSVFLGVPDEESLSILPAHKLVKKGFGFEAVKLYLLGGIFCLVLLSVLSPVFLIILPKIFFLVENKIKLYLLIIIFVLIFKEKLLHQKFIAIFVFLSSGMLGYLTLNSLNEPLLVLFSGFFALSSLFFSFSTNFPKQFITDIVRIGSFDAGFSLFSAFFSSSLVNIFPGLGISQSLSLSRFLSVRSGSYTYLFMLGGINASDILFSLFTFYLFNKHRNGSVVAIASLIQEPSFDLLLIFIGVILLTAGVAVFFTLFFTKFFIRINAFEHLKILNKIIFVLIISLVFYFSGFLGLFVLFLSTLIGIIPHLSSISRSHCMGCLLLVVLLS